MYCVGIFLNGQGFFLFSRMMVTDLYVDPKKLTYNGRQSTWPSDDPRVVRSDDPCDGKNSSANWRTEGGEQALDVY